MDTEDMCRFSRLPPNAQTPSSASRQQTPDFARWWD